MNDAGASEATLGIPRLVGERATLRPGTADDVDAILRIRQEPSVWRWWRDVTRDDVVTDLSGEDGVPLLIIEAGGQVAGGIQFSGESDPDYRHAGHDGLLMDLLAEDLLAADPACQG